MDFHLVVNGEEAEEEGHADALMVLSGGLQEDGEDLEHVSILGMEGNGEIEDLSPERKLQLCLGLIHEMSRDEDLDLRHQNFFEAVRKEFKAYALHQKSDPQEGDLTFESDR